MQFTFDIKPSNHSYVVEENGYLYEMPLAYVSKLEEFIKYNTHCPYPINEWYASLRSIEKRIVEQKIKVAEIGIQELFTIPDDEF